MSFKCQVIPFSVETNWVGRSWFNYETNCAVLAERRRCKFIVTVFPTPAEASNFQSSPHLEWTWLQIIVLSSSSGLDNLLGHLLEFRGISTRIIYNYCIATMGTTMEQSGGRDLVYEDVGKVSWCLVIKVDVKKKYTVHIPQTSMHITPASAGRMLKNDAAVDSDSEVRSSFPSLLRSIFFL